MSQTNRRNCTEAFVVDTVEEVKSQILDTLKSEVDKRIDLLKSKIIDNLIKDNKRLSKKVILLDEEIEHIHSRVYDIEVSLLDQQQRSRRNNLEISGIPNEISDENLEKDILIILNYEFKEDPITSTEIDAIHRLHSRGITKPVIIRFTGRKHRDDVFERGKDLNKCDLIKFGIGLHQKIYINDNLSQYMKTLSYYCRKLRRENLIFKTRMGNGRLKIKIREDGRWMKICHEQDLMDIFLTYNFDE